MSSSRGTTNTASAGPSTRAAMEHSSTSATGTGWEYASIRDAEGSVGRVDETRSERDRGDQQYDEEQGKRRRHRPRTGTVAQWGDGLDRQLLGVRKRGGRHRHLGIDGTVLPVL